MKIVGKHWMKETIAWQPKIQLTHQSLWVGVGEALAKSSRFCRFYGKSFCMIEIQREFELRKLGKGGLPFTSEGNCRSVIVFCW